MTSICFSRFLKPILASYAACLTLRNPAAQYGRNCIIAYYCMYFNQIRKKKSKIYIIQAELFEYEWVMLCCKKMQTEIIISSE